MCGTSHDSSQGVIMSDFRQRCIAFDRVVGIFCAIPHPVAVEVSAAAGPDFLCIDWEHAQIGRERIEDLIRAADVQRVPAMVRVPAHGSEWTAAVLDAGAAGVLVPRISTAEQARAAVKATRFPPLGERGLGPGRATAYGYQIPDYLAAANEKLVLAIQVETAEGLANIDEIVAVEGVDVIFVGPADLAASLGATTPADAARLDAAIVTIAWATRNAGKAAGIFRPMTSDVAKWAEAGVTFFLLGSDARYLGAGIAAGMEIGRQA